MKIGVLGTGVVGRTIATKLRELGHDVLVGSRSAGDDAVPFAEAAAHGELLFNCTSGVASLEALGTAGAENVSGKVLVDVANPVDFSRGMPPTLTICNDDSLGEQIQRTFPDTRVVKALNTVTAGVMVDPISDTNLFVCGNDDGAKSQVRELLETFGWTADAIVDLGDITAARGQEMYLPLWLRLMGVYGPQFNINVVH